MQCTVLITIAHSVIVFVVFFSISVCGRPNSLPGQDQFIIRAWAVYNCSIVIFLASVCLEISILTPRKVIGYSDKGWEGIFL